MTELNESIKHIAMPTRIAKLPISPRGFPVPWFVAQINGEYDFRIVDTPKRMRAVRNNMCWLCGETLGRYKSFLIGTMCTITRTISEPPAHRDCSEYAIAACPFLSNPRMRRNDKDLPDHELPAGIMLTCNPKVTVLWITHEYRLFRDHDGGTLFRIGAPVEVQFYREGRKATRAEIMESIESGLPELRDRAAAEGREAVEELELQYRKALEILPAV
jgi:hypothetical protein